MNRLIAFVQTYPYLVLILSFTIGFLFMPVVIQLAKKYHFVVSPNKRTSHDGDVPNIGGINIFISFLFTVLLFSSIIFEDIQYALVGLFIVLIVGFIDDLLHIKIGWKLFGEFLSGFFLIVIADVKLSNLHGFLGVYELPLFLSYLLSFFVFVVIVNALNLIDGVDGLASGLGIIYTLFFGIYFQLVNRFNLAITAYAMTGSLIVFFYYNVFSSRKKIFMGDSGALLLGYIINLFVFSFCGMNAAKTVPEQYYMSAAPAVAIAVLMIPLFDTIRVMLTRIKKGRSPFSADKNHIHHLLLRLGLKHKEVSFLLIGTSLFFIFIGLLFRNIPIWLLTGILLIIATALTKLLWVSLDKKNKEKSSNQFK